MSWKRHVQLVPYGERLQKQLEKASSGRSNGMGGGTGGKFSSFLPEIYAGAPNRIERYGQYNQMDLDTEISRALDTIADFCTQQEEAKDTPFEPNMKEDASESEQEILKQALTQWSDTNEFRKRLWRTFRNVIKYGDQFFVRDPETLKWHWVDHCKVEQIMVDPETKEPIQYLIRGLNLNLATLQATAGSPDAMTGSGLPGGFQSGLSSTKVMPQSSSMGGNQSVNAMSGQTNDPATMIVTAVDAIHVVHLSLGEGMDDNWPFGTSILESIFKTYKQKELLEDAILIYRVQRAPERRIFKIDTGNMPTHKAMAYLERVKNEIHQRRIPNRNGGGTCFDMNTKVPLLDGRTLTITELSKEYESGKTNWVYSCDPKTGRMVPGKITWAGITRKDADVIKMTLDNGEVIICTPDHKFPILGKGKTEAKDIEIGIDSMISFNSRTFSINERDNDKDPQYHQVYDHSKKDWIFTHRVVANFFKDKNLHNEMIFESASGEKRTIHHIDFKKQNNNPENLAFMSPLDHFLLHSKSSKEFHASLSDFEKARISALISESGKAAWVKRKENIEWYDQYRRVVSQRSKIMAASPEHFLRLMVNLKEEQQRPWRNQSLQWNQTMLSIIDDFLKSGVRSENEMIHSLSNSDMFMQGYRTMNISQNKMISKLNTDIVSSDTLRKFINAMGCKSWKVFLEERGYKIRRPTRTLKWNQEILSCIVKKVNENPVDSMPIIASKLENDFAFMQLFGKMNNCTKGNGKPNKFSTNTLRVAIEYFGFDHWTDFKNKLPLYNHKVVSIETYGNMDVGTITVDGNEEFHDFHTFALDVGVYTFNSIMDAAYNPMAMMDDYFFAQGEGGRGSDVSTLAGGDNLGQIDDLKYFNNKLLRGLGIPSSYLPTGEDDGSAAYSDGKVGTAYIQEYRFSKYCQRLQNMISDVFDEEFKLFLKQKDLNIESSMFELNFCPPQNFSRFRQIEIDGAQIGVFGQLADIPFFSKRFLMERYLGLNEEEILDNERKWKEEQWKKVKKSTGMDDSKESAPGIGNVGVRSPPPMDMDMGGMDDMDGMDDGMGGDSDMGSESPISGSETGGELEI